VLLSIFVSVTMPLVARNIQRRMATWWTYYEPLWQPGFQPTTGHVGFLVAEVAMGQVFFQYFCFPCQFSFHRTLHIHHLPSGACTICHLVADVPSRLSFTPPQEETYELQSVQKKTIVNYSVEWQDDRTMSHKVCRRKRSWTTASNGRTIVRWVTSVQKKTTVN
jgi:hypothetical protein